MTETGVYKQLAIRVNQSAGEFEKGKEKSKDSAKTQALIFAQVIIRDDFSCFSHVHIRYAVIEKKWLVKELRKIDICFARSFRFMIKYVSIIRLANKHVSERISIFDFDHKTIIIPFSYRSLHLRLFVTVVCNLESLAVYFQHIKIYMLQKTGETVMSYYKK